MNQTHKHTIADNHISKKKKNTYQIALSPLGRYDLFSFCPMTPLAISCENGTRHCDGWMRSKKFPTECAQEIAHLSPSLRAKLGPKISATIIEYLDMNTGEPVAQLYPTTLYVFDKFEPEYLSHLNHATRRDLQKQMAIRARLLSEYYGVKQK